MTLDEAMFTLHKKGLPNPTPLSVFFLYEKKNGSYIQTANFELKFQELLQVQKTIQHSCLSLNQK